MSIQFTGDVQISRAISNLFVGVPAFTFFFKIRYDGDPVAPNGNQFLVNSWAWYQFNFTKIDQAAHPGCVSFSMAIQDTKNHTYWAPQGLILQKGQTYPITVSYGSQVVLYHNGLAYVCGANPAPIGSGQTNFYVGRSSVSQGGAVTPVGMSHSMQDLAIWYNYAATAADAAALLQGQSTPGTLATPATYWWPMTGTIGANVANGDPGITEKNGHAAFNLTIQKNANQAGAALVYSDDLEWAPATHFVGSVGTSGTSVYGWPVTKDGSFSQETAYYQNPTITIVGAKGGQNIPLGQSVLRTANSFGYQGQHWYIPAPYAVTSATDQVTLSAPLAWVATNAGTAAAEVNTPLTNNFGVSIHGVETAPKGLMKIGYDCTWDLPMFAVRNLALYYGGAGNINGFIPSAKRPWLAPKGSTPAGNDGWGHPITPANPLFIPLLYNNGDLYFDQTNDPLPYGLWMTQVDDYGDATNHPLVFGMAVYDSTAQKYYPAVERTDLRNPGVYDTAAGCTRGVCRVFDVEPPAGLAYTHQLQIGMTFYQDQGTYNGGNYQVFRPGDFTYGSGPVSPIPYNNLVTSNAWNTLVGPKGNGVRSVDTTWTGPTQMQEPEWFRKPTDLCWAASGNAGSFWATATQYQPCDVSVWPYVYSGIFGDQFGETYQATLAADIDAPAAGTIEKIVIPDASNAPTAATGPVMAGQKLSWGNEIASVLLIDPDGITATVERGSCGTTPEACKAGPIGVKYRHKLTAIQQYSPGFATNHCDCWVVVTQGPHNLRYGMMPDIQGPWPTAPMTTGFNAPPGALQPILVGQNAFVWAFAAFDYSTSTTATHVTLAAGTTVTLPAGCKVGWSWPDDGTRYPLEFVAKTTPANGTCVFTMPFGMTDRAVWAAAKIFHDNLDPSCSIILEDTNEPWNGGYTDHALMDSCDIWFNNTQWHPQFRYFFLIYRTSYVWKIFQQVFADRPGKVRCWINLQRGDYQSLPQYLAMAVATNSQITDFAHAPYFGLNDPIAAAGSATVVQTLPPEYLLDLMSWYNLYARDYAIGGSNRVEAEQFSSVLTNFNNNVGGVNPHGWQVGMNIYELNFDGIQATSYFNLTAAVPAGAAGDSITISVSSVANRAPGQFLVLGITQHGGPQMSTTSEVVQITNVLPATKQLVVTRGINGTPTPAHASGLQCRDTMLELNKQIAHHPAMYRNWQEVCYVHQRYGYLGVWMMGTTVPSVDPSWGTVGHNQQIGYGDGRDMNNLQYLLAYGSPSTKPANVSYWANVVSVIGQAVRDWNDGVYLGPGSVPVVQNQAVAALQSTTDTSKLFAVQALLEPATSVQARAIADVQACTDLGKLMQVKSLLAHPVSP